MRPFLAILFSFCLVFTSKSQTWHTMGAGVTNAAGNANVHSISYYNSKITIGGYFKSSGSTMLNSISQWDGNNWNALGTGLWHDGTPDYAGIVSAITYYDSVLYVGGGFVVAGGTSAFDMSHSEGNIAKWDGSQWLPMTQWGSDGLNSVCTKFQVYHNNLYLGGFFNASTDSSGSYFTQGISKWNDTTFSAIGQFAGNLAPYGYDAAMALCTYNDKLIAGGFFNSVNGSPYGSYGYIASYNDTTWDSLSSGLNNVVFSLAVYNGELYAGGNFTATGAGVPVNHVAKWNGTQWLPVGEGLNDSVWVLCVDSAQNKLYAGGEFTQTGLGAPAKHIAEWTGTNWQEVGGGTNAFVLSLFAKDSNLYVGGAFTMAGSTPANRIAVWGNNSVGINEPKNTNQFFNIYPNPANNFIDVETEFKNYSISVFDNMGKLILRENSNQNKTRINLSPFSNGIYFIQLQSNGKLVSKKFIKE